MRRRKALENSALPKIPLLRVWKMPQAPSFHQPPAVYHHPVVIGPIIKPYTVVTYDDKTGKNTPKNDDFVVLPGSV